ncbi:MAG: ROK family glucokinase [Acidimicrobiales bacterium]
MSTKAPAVSIGVDVGGTKCLGVVVRGDVVVAEHRLPTPRTGPGLVHTVAAVVERLRAGAPGAPVGVGAPGLVDDHGTLRFAPNLPGVSELRLRDLLVGRLGHESVVVDNDATCACWAETRLGAAIGRSHVLMATIGTGIGGGLVADGVLQRGRHGFAGEIGHMVVDPGGPRCPCGQSGCWERFASGTGLGWIAREAAQAGVARRVVELAGGDPEAVRGEHVTVAAAEGDHEAMAVMGRFAWWLALGLANLANALDPELIVLGGGMIEAGSVLLDPAREAFARLLEGAAHRPRISIVAAELGERAGAVGAALRASDE